ncbi:MAG: hypothetical protein QW453_07140 [Thermoprotei archaeon]
MEGAISGIQSRSVEGNILCALRTSPDAFPQPLYVAGLSGVVSLWCSLNYS